jgi:6-phosphogluconate dehydrogenase
MSADIAVIGLAVMGENLILNFESRGFTVAVYNRTTAKVDAFLSGRGKGKKLVGCHSVEELAKALKKPRKVMMMVMAGDPVDQTIHQLLPYLEKGDIVIDGGNSHFTDTNRRVKELEFKGFLFVGSGVSGGEEGALKGPSLMPGGSAEAWNHIKPLFQAISAKVVEDGNAPCCEWIGEEGAGHFVKMVHNGIEYGDMQLISEAYDLLHRVIGLDNEEIAKAFLEYNKGDLDSFLIEITADIFKKRDDVDPNAYLIDRILDAAGQKGTGKWTVEAGLDLGVPITLISEAVFARVLSAQKAERVQAAKLLPAPPSKFEGDKAQMIRSIGQALYASKIISYAQGFAEMRAAADQKKWHLRYGTIALTWRGGCIIRSKFLGKIKEAFERNPQLQNLLLDDFFRQKIQEAQLAWRQVAAAAVLNGIPIPAISSALAYYDGYRTERLPANLLQAQRDYFGAHTYERVDRPRGQFFHTNWTGHGGTTSASTYNA